MDNLEHLDEQLLQIGADFCSFPPLEHHSQNQLSLLLLEGRQLSKLSRTRKITVDVCYVQSGASTNRSRGCSTSPSPLLPSKDSRPTARPLAAGPLGDFVIRRGVEDLTPPPISA